MERLTFEGNFCDISQCSEVPGGSFCEDGSCSQKKVWARLKAYENTGFEPEEVTALGKLFDYALKESKTLTEQLTLLKHIRELAEADKEGHVVVLPCKVGDTVFARLDNKSKYVCECKVKQIVVGNIGFVTFAPIGAPEREYDVSLRGFGKTVFFSREEAEKALQKMEDKKDG